MKKRKNYLYKIVLLLVIPTTLLTGCHSKVRYVNDTQFIGVWEPLGFSKLYQGMQLNIKQEDGKLKGYISQVPDNKYAQLFLEVGDCWITKINRSSNFQFRITQSRIASELFRSYGLATSDEYKVQFISQDTIGLSSGEQSPIQSTLRYVKVSN